MSAASASVEARINASFHSREKNAPSKPGIKHLAVKELATGILGTRTDIMTPGGRTPAAWKMKP
jgi:hypothetical protein